MTTGISTPPTASLTCAPLDGRTSHDQRQRDSHQNVRVDGGTTILSALSVDGPPRLLAGRST